MGEFGPTITPPEAKQAKPRLINGVAMSTEPNAGKLVGWLNKEGKLAKYEQYRETVKGRVLMTLGEQGYPEMASALVRDFFHEDLNPEQESQLESWQPDVAQGIALQELAQALSMALENKIKPHSVGMTSDLRIHPYGGPSEQESLDFQQGENLLYSILLSNNNENFDLEIARKTESDHDKALREAAGGGSTEQAKWRPGTAYETIIPGAVLRFKGEDEIGNGAPAEFEVDSKKQ